jgi:hypothetical protein
MCYADAACAYTVKHMPRHLLAAHLLQDLIRDMLDALMDAGADINATTTGLGTPVMQALWQKKLPVAQLLLGGWSKARPVDNWQCSSLPCPEHCGNSSAVQD